MILFYIALACVALIAFWPLLLPLVFIFALIDFLLDEK